MDTSDHEVNIKILLAGEVAAGRLTLAEDRDVLLASMTDEVAELVLAHNYDQNLALANAVCQAAVDGRRARGLDGAAGGPGAAGPGDRVPAARRRRWRAGAASPAG